MRWFKKVTKPLAETEIKSPQSSLTPPSTNSVETTINTPPSMWSRLLFGLSKTRQVFGSKLSALILGAKKIDSELLESIEILLLTADVGLEVTRLVIQKLTEKLERQELKNAEVLITALKTLLQEMLHPPKNPWQLPTHHHPTLILVVGVNGAGKTTTIGKLGQQLKSQGKLVALAAGDTFRAAAIEQLQVWGNRHQIPVLSQLSNKDSAAVIFDAFQLASSQQFDVLLADTAGRLHTKSNLMEELKKITRVVKKIDPLAPHEIWLVIDASMGQNALQQAIAFHENVPITGIVLTKLDGTAKGGIVFSIAHHLKLPILFIGIGEQADDLRPFDAHDFVEALFADSSSLLHPAS